MIVRDAQGYIDHRSVDMAAVSIQILNEQELSRWGEVRLLGAIMSLSHLGGLHHGTSESSFGRDTSLSS